MIGVNFLGFHTCRQCKPLVSSREPLEFVNLVDYSGKLTRLTKSDGSGAVGYVGVYNLFESRHPVSHLGS